MFFDNSETELEGGRLRCGKKFLLGKRRRTATRRGRCSATKGEDYKLEFHLDKGYCDEEEEYRMISVVIS